MLRSWHETNFIFYSSWWFGNVTTKRGMWCWVVCIGWRITFVVVLNWEIWMLENLSLWWVPVVCICCLLLWFVELLLGIRFVCCFWSTRSSKKIVGWFLSWGRRFFFPSQKLRVVVLAVESFIFSIDKNVSRGPFVIPSSHTCVTADSQQQQKESNNREQQSSSTYLHEQRYVLSVRNCQLQNGSINKAKIGQVATDGTTQSKFMPVSPVSPSDATPARSFTLW